MLGRDRASYAGATTLVVGAGHSAANVLVDLTRLGDEVPGTAVLWATRGGDPRRVYGGGSDDDLPARGDLGITVRSLVANGRVSLTTGFPVTALAQVAGRLVAVGGVGGNREFGPFDRVVATGQRPDLDLTRELRLDLDPWLESARALGCQSALKRAPLSAPKRGSGAKLVLIGSLFHPVNTMRARRRSILPRPYIWRRTSLSLVTCPSV